MRIISGKLKGKKFIIPNNLFIRPTTDYSKEALFNILNNQISFNNLYILDLFCGSGNISYEFASRGLSSKIKCIDNNKKCIRYINNNIKIFNLYSNIEVINYNVYKFLKKDYNNSYNIVFADPPYNISIKNLKLILKLIIELKLIKPNGLIILEHNIKNIINYDSLNRETRNYGNTFFSFFKKLQS